MLTASCALWFGLPVQAGTQTWRCGNAYADRPCEGGKALTVDDSRSDQDRRAADAATRSARTQADQMERTRLAQEKTAYDRDRQAAREARSAALAERRMALSEQLARERAHKAVGDPRKSSTSFRGAAASKASGEGPARKKKKRKSAGSDAG